MDAVDRFPHPFPPPFADAWGDDEFGLWAEFELPSALAPKSSERGAGAYIFLSFAREDIETAKRLDAALRARGWEVWWDARLKAGEIWDEKIERALDEACCVVVLWSASSIARQWVRAEAHSGQKRRILVP